MYFYNIDHCLRVMILVGVHPDVKKYKFQLFLCIFPIVSMCLLGSLVLMTLYYREDKVSMIDITEAITPICLFLHSMVKLINLYIKRSSLLDILNSMHKNFWKLEDIDDPHEKYFFSKISAHLKRKFHYFLALSSISTMYFCFGRLIIDKRRIGYNLPYGSYIPEKMSFEVLFIVQLFVGGLLIIPIFAMDILVLTILTLTKMQFKLLNAVIPKMFQGMTNSDEDANNIKMRFKKCNDHHSFLMEEKLNDVFSAGMLGYMGVIIPTQCLEMYVLSSQSSTKESIRAVLYAATMFFEFFICYCLPAQDLIDEVEELPDSIYSSNWNRHPKHYQDILLFLGKSQLKMSISAGGFANIDLQTGFAALKTMVSYCMFLKTVVANSEEQI